MEPLDRIELYTFVLYGTTDNTGTFSIAHDLAGVYDIKSINVAIQHVNGNWHVLEISNSVDNRFWWNDLTVQGKIASSSFYNRSVKIIIHALPV